MSALGVKEGKTTMVTRRGFVGGALAFGTCGAFGAVSPAVGAAPRLRFGVMSDVHIGGKPDAAARAEKVLRWFAAKDVDAVLCPGDIAHSGLISELEAFADAWHRVFPGNGERSTYRAGEIAALVATTSSPWHFDCSLFLIPVPSNESPFRTEGAFVKPPYQRFSMRCFSKQARQYTGRSPRGWKGT